MRFRLRRRGSCCHVGWRGARGETEEGKGEGRGQGRRDTRQVTATSGAAAEAEADPGR